LTLSTGGSKDKVQVIAWLFPHYSDNYTTKSYRPRMIQLSELWNSVRLIWI